MESYDVTIDQHLHLPVSAVESGGGRNIRLVLWCCFDGYYGP